MLLEFEDEFSEFIHVVEDEDIQEVMEVLYKMIV